MAKKEKEFVDNTKYIEKTPTIDAVEVVRCKECKYYYDNKYDRPLCELVTRTTKGNGYCSYGERREDE